MSVAQSWKLNEQLWCDAAVVAIFFHKSFDNSWTWRRIYCRNERDFHLPCNIMMWSSTHAKCSCIEKLVLIEWVPTPSSVNPSFCVHIVLQAALNWLIISSADICIPLICSAYNERSSCRMNVAKYLAILLRCSFVSGWKLALDSHTNALELSVKANIFGTCVRILLLWLQQLQILID